LSELFIPAFTPLNLLKENRMDPIGLIVNALAAGAASGMKPMAEGAIKDAYAGIKSLITRKYSSVKLEQLEANPKSEPARETTAATLAGAGADKDQELLEKVRALLDTVARHDPQTTAAFGIVIKEVESLELEIRKLSTQGAGMLVEKSKIDKISIGEADIRPANTSPNP
jgi:hypothetical protein